jgi:hypothetical protein
MINTPIIYDPATGMFVADSSASNEFLNPIQNVQLLNGLPAGACVAIINYTAQIVTSKYNHNYTGLSTPRVDGILLQGGNAGDTVPMACINGYTYNNPALSLGFIGDTLYLGQNGLPTPTPPSFVAGDLWYEIIARRVNDKTFIFTPFNPIALSETVDYLNST